jgi:SNF2 family DNA or RNA helicase
MLQREVELGVPFTEETIEVDMTAAQKKVYNKLAKDYVAWTEGNEEISAWSDGGLHTKLMQVSTGLELLVENEKGSGKFDVLSQLLDDAPRSPTLVFAHYRESAQIAYDLARSKGLRAGLIRGGVSYAERTDIEKRFRDKELDVVVGTLDTVATGLNLANACTEIFLEHGWSPWVNDQAIKRAFEFGKKEHVHVIHLYTKKTVDIGQRKLVANKSSHQVKGLKAREMRGIIYG